MGKGIESGMDGEIDSGKFQTRYSLVRNELLIAIDKKPIQAISGPIAELFWVVLLEAAKMNAPALTKAHDSGEPGQ